MRRVPIVAFILLGGLSAAMAGEPARGKLVLELWDAAYLENGKAGYVHTFTEEFQQNKETVLRTTVELRLTVKRNAEVIQLSMDTGTTETLEGKVVGVFMKQFLGKDKSLELTGSVSAGKLHVLVDGKEADKAEPWDARVVGLFRQQTMFKEKQIKPGDAFDYLSYEPTINAVVPTFVRVKDYEEVELFGGQQKKRLLRVETRTAKIDKVQMPPLTSWVGENRTVQRSQVDVPGLGTVVLYRASKAVATAPGRFELFDGHRADAVRSAETTDHRSLRGHRGRVSNHGARRRRSRPAPFPAMPGSRSRTSGATPSNFMSAPRRADQEDKKPGVEFTQSSYFINSADPTCQETCPVRRGKRKRCLEKSPAD